MAYLVILGTVSSGLSFVGPFSTPSGAAAWAGEHALFEWDVVDCISPDGLAFDDERRRALNLRSLVELARKRSRDAG